MTVVFLFAAAIGVVLVVRAAVAVAQDYRSSASPYRTVSRRIAAALVDVLIFVPVSSAMWWVWDNVTTPAILVACFTLQSFAGLTYSIVLHGLYGQTVGKWVTGVKVISSSGAKLSIRQAFLRDLVVLIATVYSFAVGVSHIASGRTPFEMGSTFGENIHHYAFSLWIFLELATMLFSHQRRAIHDFIAGSVVVRLDVPGFALVENEGGV